MGKPEHRPSSGYYIELCGGQRDGRVIPVTVEVLRGRTYRHPHLPNAPDVITEETTFLPCDLHIETWRWDGTVTRQGFYRFRLAA